MANKPTVYGKCDTIFYCYGGCVIAKVTCAIYFVTSNLSVNPFIRSHIDAVIVRIYCSV